MSNDDFITGRALSEMQELAQNIAMSSKIRQEDALNILKKVGFYEERYGAKPHVYDSIIMLANSGCSPEHIFACIKLLPGARKAEYQTISKTSIETARKVLAGENSKPFFPNGKRAVDL